MLFKIAIFCGAWFLLVGSGLAAVCWNKAKQEQLDPDPGWLLGILFFFPLFYPLFMLIKIKNRSIIGMIFGCGFLFLVSFVICMQMSLNTAAHATRDEIDAAAQSVKASGLYRPWNIRMMLDLELASLYAPFFTQAMQSGDVFQALDLWELRQNYVNDALTALGQHANLKDPRIKKNVDGLNQKLEQAKKQGAALYFSAGKIESDKKSWPQAVNDLTRSIDMDPANPHAYLVRGNSNFQQGRRDLALQDCDRACGMGLPSACQSAAAVRAQSAAPAAQ